MVRSSLGPARFDTAAQTNAMSQLPEKMWRGYNLSQPLMCLLERTTTPAPHVQRHPLRIKRRFDSARTRLNPYVKPAPCPWSRRRNLELFVTEQTLSSSVERSANSSIVFSQCRVPFQGERKTSTRPYLHLLRSRNLRPSRWHHHPRAYSPSVIA